VRVLVTFVGGSGHLLPLLPVARALAYRGHDVALSCQHAMLDVAEGAGFQAFDSGGATLAYPGARGPLRPVDRAREERAIRDGFAGHTATERAGRLVDVATRWKPQVVVHDEVDLGAIVAAESLGFPHVGVIVLAAGGLLRPDLVAERLDVLRTAHQLPPDPGLAALHRHLTLVPVPPSFRAPTDPLPSTARHVRPAVLEPMGTSLGAPGAAAVLDWIGRRHGQPTVYLTLGTIFSQESGDLLSRVLAGLVELDVNVIVTVGREIDPTELAHQPTNVRVEQYLPQEVLLPHCDVVVCHGGSGSVLGALAFGVPLVLLPMGADQPLNGDRCEALGVARVLDPITTTRSLITATVREILTTPSYRRAAQRLRNEAATLPPAQQAASWVEVLVESDSLKHRPGTGEPSPRTGR